MDMKKTYLLAALALTLSSSTLGFSAATTNRSIL
jgi:hypothetical protein